MTTGSEFTIGILEFGECEPTDPKKIIDQSVLVAREAEILGYRRYWLAEHHTRRSAWASAEIVIAAVASATRKIAVGSGGTLLNYHSTLDIVNSYSLLGRMFPGRIELGLGRGIPVCNAIQLRESLGKKERATEAEYESRVRELLRYLTVHDQSAPDESIHCPVPALHNPVPVWILGTGSSARASQACAGYHSHFPPFTAVSPISRPSMPISMVTKPQHCIPRLYVFWPLLESVPKRNLPQENSWRKG